MAAGIAQTIPQAVPAVTRTRVKVTEMAARPVLIVVAVGDAEIRSLLAERLALQGVNLLTASGWGDGLLDRPVIRDPAILVVDEAAVAGEPGDWIEGQRQRGRWQRMVVLTENSPKPADGREWLVRVHRRSPGDLLSALFSDGTPGTAA